MKQAITQWLQQHLHTNLFTCTCRTAWKSPGPALQPLLGDSPDLLSAVPPEVSHKFLQVAVACTVEKGFSCLLSCSKYISQMLSSMPHLQAWTASFLHVCQSSAAVYQSGQQQRPYERRHKKRGQSFSLIPAANRQNCSSNFVKSC